jgi:chromosome segregation ATPase
MIQSLIQQAKDELDKLDALATEKQAVIAQADATLDKAEQELIAMQASIDKVHKDYEQEILKTEKEATPYRKELAKLKDEVSGFVQRKSELMIANAELERQNKEFMDYEKGAWKVLNAKDEELTAREKTISEKEQLRPGVKTFLPSM